MFFLRDDEDSFDWRRRPIEAYKKPDAVLSLPQRALDATVGTLRQYRKLEAGCFWYGTRDNSENGLVKAVVVPFQLNRWGNYHVPSQSISAMSAATRTFGWVCLAQVHSHPGSFVEHSAYDDENTSSQRILSVVIPNYGKWRFRWPKAVGVHEWQNGYWHMLPDKDAAFRIRVEAGAGEVTFIDLRNEL